MLGKPVCTISTKKDFAMLSFGDHSYLVEFLAKKHYVKISRSMCKIHGCLLLPTGPKHPTKAEDVKPITRR